MAAGENRSSPVLNEREVIDLLEDYFVSYLGGIFNKTIIIPLALVGYEMIIANSWNNC